MQIDTGLLADGAKALIGSLKPVIADIIGNYSFDQLLMIHYAMYGNDVIIPEDERGKVTPEKKEEIVSKPDYSNKSRKKVRINLKVDMSYATPLFEHLYRYEHFSVIEIKTGLAVKYEYQGFRVNILNYNELRTIKGTLHGNLYMNCIHTDEEFEGLNIDLDKKWFRGFACIPLVDIYSVIEILNSDNITYLLKLSTISQKRRLTNAKKLLSLA